MPLVRFGPQSLATVAVLTGLVLLGGCAGSDRSQPSARSGSTAAEVVRVKPLPAGSRATWEVAPRQRLTPGTTSFTATVLGMGCNGGELQTAEAPSIVETSDEVEVTFSVTPAPDPDELYACVMRTPLPTYRVRLDHPLGDRVLVDGICRHETESSSFCDPDGFRWSQEKGLDPAWLPQPHRRPSSTP